MPRMAGETHSVSRTGIRRRFRLFSEHGDHIRVYENLSALPQAYLVHQARLSGSESETLEILSRHDFDPRSQVVLEASPKALREAAGAARSTDRRDSGKDRVMLRRSGQNQVEVFSQSGSPGVLILTDTFYPGWNAYVDGSKSPILRANYLFRAVTLSAGQHHVQFRYEPFSFWLGVVLTGVAFVAGGAVILYGSGQELRYGENIG